MVSLDIEMIDTPIEVQTTGQGDGIEIVDAPEEKIAPKKG